MTSVTFTKADNTAYSPGTWTNQTIYHNLSASDGSGSGVSYYQYSENNGDVVTSSNPTKGEWSGDRNSNVKFRAVDAVGNVGSWSADYNLKIDKTGPTVTSVTFKKADNTAYSPGNWTNQTIYHNLSASDGSGSGVSYYQYSENDGAAVTSSNPAKGEWSGERNSNVKFRAVDAAGNVGNWTGNYNLKIDKTGPTMTTVSFKKADNTAYSVGTWSTQNIIQTLGANDGSGSGVSYFQHTTNRRFKCFYICKWRSAYRRLELQSSI